MILKGNIVYMKDKDTAVTVGNGCLSVRDGIIEEVFPEGAGRDRPAGEDIIDYGDRLIIPGMTDLHLHASQFGFLGLGMDTELLEWLEANAFKEEAKFSDIDYAAEIYGEFTNALLRSPTTRACIFATVHKESTLLLARMLEERGFCALVGKVNMDRLSPPALTEDTLQSVKDTVDFIERMLSECKNVKPIITPRFVPSCTDRLMTELGRLRKKYSLPVQSHLSENPEEINLVRRLCPRAGTYGEAYDMFGLFGGDHKAVMAHCVYSEESEIELMKKNGVFIAHCANSNYSLSSGIAPIRKYLDMGLDIGLGTDISGGFSISMFRCIQDAIAVSKLLRRFDESSPKPLSFREAFYLATMGGGSFFGKTGSFIPGYDADILVLSDPAGFCPTGLSPEKRLERICCLSENDAVYAKYIKGRLVFKKDQTLKC